MIQLNDALILFQAYKEQYIFLWAFYFTASIGIVGFCYGHSNVRRSQSARLALTVVYLLLVVGNYFELSSTRDLMASIKSSLQEYMASTNDVSGNTVNIGYVLEFLRVPTSTYFSGAYLAITALVASGIWFFDIIRLMNRNKG